MKHFLILLTIGLISKISFAQGTPAIHIYSINGQLNSSDLREISVRPGDSLLLTADFFDDRDNPQGDSADDFIWSDENGLSCDLMSSRQCESGSNFQAVDDGVIYHVPQNISRHLTITLRSHSQDSAIGTFFLYNSNRDSSSWFSRAAGRGGAPAPAPAPGPRPIAPGNPTPTPGNPHPTPGNPSPVQPGNPKPTPGNPTPIQPGNPTPRPTMSLNATPPTDPGKPPRPTPINPPDPTVPPAPRPTPTPAPQPQPPPTPQLS